MVCDCLNSHCTSIRSKTIVYMELLLGITLIASHIVISDFLVYYVQRIQDFLAKEQARGYTIYMIVLCHALRVCNKSTGIWVLQKVCRSRWHKKTQGDVRLIIICWLYIIMLAELHESHWKVSVHIRGLWIFARGWADMIMGGGGVYHGWDKIAQRYIAF